MYVIIIIIMIRSYLTVLAIMMREFPLFHTPSIYNHNMYVAFHHFFY